MERKVDVDVQGSSQVARGEAEAPIVGKRTLAGELDGNAHASPMQWENIDPAEVEDLPTGRMDAKPVSPPSRLVVHPVEERPVSKQSFVYGPAAPNQHDPLANQKTLGGVDLASVQTRREEAMVLNLVRGQDKKFEPATLLEAQQKLGVANATGAFNTETLRKLRASAADPRLKDPKAKAADIVAAVLDDAVWRPFVTGSAPLFASLSPLQGSAKASKTAKKKADLVVQAIGYASYDEYRESFQPLTFLGIPAISGGPLAAEPLAHPYLLSRLKLAERFLEQRHGPNVKPADFGWHGQLVGAYQATTAHVNAGKKHFHTLGLAVDFDPGQNGWFYNESIHKNPTRATYINKNNDIKKRNQQRSPNEPLEPLFDADTRAQLWAKENEQRMDAAFTQAGHLFKAVVLTRANLDDWGRSLSTEELHARLASAAEAMKKYVALAKTGSDKSIREAFAAAGYSPTQTTKALPQMREFPQFYLGINRPKSGKPTEHKLELLVALRDVAGLSFGGTDMIGGDNGDFMHFDCRNTEIGTRAQAISLSLG